MDHFASELTLATVLAGGIVAVAQRVGPRNVPQTLALTLQLLALIAERALLLSLLIILRFIRRRLRAPMK